MRKKTCRIADTGPGLMRGKGFFLSLFLIFISLKSTQVKDFLRINDDLWEKWINVIWSARTRWPIRMHWFAWTNGLIRTDIHWYASQRSTITLIWITRILRWFDWASTHRNALQLIGQVSDFLSPFLRGKKETTYIVFGAPTPSKSIDFDVRRNGGEIVFFFPHSDWIEQQLNWFESKTWEIKIYFKILSKKCYVTSRHVTSSTRIDLKIWENRVLSFYPLNF